MSESLESQITDIVETLKQTKKTNLAKCIEDNWQTTALAYSAELNVWNPPKPMELELLVAFEHELERNDADEALKEKIIGSLNKRRILQTAPHLVATENPRMLTINWLGSLAVPSNEFYVVGMFSGIPFSNNFRPGRINMKHEAVNLFPSTMQDGLVYRSVITDKLIETIKDLPADIKKLLPEAIIGESYTKWALATCQKIERKILNKENLIYIDINEVVSNYLVQVLKNKEHIFYKIFFDPKTREEFINMFPRETIFYVPAMMSKYETMKKIAMADLGTPEELIKELREQRWCPALITGFLCLAFLNQFKCFGSFSQVEYLPEYQEKLAKLSFLKEFNIEKVPTANLTTGSFHNALYPADIITGEKFETDPNILFGELLISVKDKLIK